MRSFLKTNVFTLSNHSQTLSRSTIAQYRDLRSALERGCTAFLSLGISINDAGTMNVINVAVVLGFKRQEDCGTSALKMARMMMQTAASDFPHLIADFLITTSLLVAPRWLQTVDSDHEHSDEEEPLLTGEEEEENEEILQSEPPDLAYNSFTLEFKLAVVETAFAAEHDAASMKLDAFGYLWCFFAMSWALFWPNTRFNQPGLAMASSLWRFFICFPPVFLILNERTRSLYIRHREPILIYTLLTTMAWHRHVEHYVDILSTEEFMRPLYLHGYVWLAVIISLFQARIRVLMPLSLVCFIWDATLIPKLCSRFYPSTRPTVCISLETLWVGAFALVAPLMLVWVVEKRSRDNFKRRIQQE